MENNRYDIFLYGILLFALVVLCIVVFYKNVVRPFLGDRQYIKTQMQCAYDEDEYCYWKNELKKVYISQIPFLGKVLVHHIR